MAAPQDLLGDLNAAQAEAVTTDAAPLCILAGAGSGKTRVLTRRIAWRIRAGSADPSHVLALTFTRKAAGELRGRLGRMEVRDQVAAGTFHGIALAQLRRRWADADRQPPVILQSKAGLLSSLLPKSSPALDSLASIAGEIEWAKARMVSPNDYDAAAAEAGRRPPVEEMVSLYERYEERKQRRGLVDFDDLLLGCIEALTSDAAFAASQRWRFRHLFVDEYQDINPAQALLLSLWLGGRSDLCVVGDPNQAIYSWNGADPSQLLSFADRFPGAAVLSLDHNYRSTPQVLAVANAVLAHGRSGSSGAPRAERGDGAVPRVTCYASDTEEARSVARALRRNRRPGVSWSEMAVLARTNAQLVLLEETLRAAAVPYRVSGGGAFLEQPAVKAAVTSMRANTSFSSCLDHLRELVGSAEDSDEDGRMHLEQLVRLALEYRSVDLEASGDGFAAWLATSMRAETADEGRDLVELTTFHRAKGLEWPIVFVTGLEQGLVPIGHASGPSEEAEERRLLYVAMTRAKDELHCSWAERRTFGWKTVSRRPSPYLDAVEAVCRGLLANSGEEPGRIDQLLATRSKLAAARKPAQAIASEADAELLASLREWRAQAARLSGVPAYVIFHDTTLAAIARARPAGLDDLLALPGMGKVKAARYGEALLSLVAGSHGDDEPGPVSAMHPRT